MWNTGDAHAKRTISSKPSKAHHAMPSEQELRDSNVGYLYHTVSRTCLTSTPAIRPFLPQPCPHYPLPQLSGVSETRNHCLLDTYLCRCLDSDVSVWSEDTSGPFTRGISCCMVERMRIYIQTHMSCFAPPEPVVVR